VANPLQERLAEILLDTIARDEYPSATHMDMFESFAPLDLQVRYALVLLDRIEGDPHPSIPMMRRVQRLVTSFG
jgi:hypothetical protein